MGTEVIHADSDSNDWLSLLKYDDWVPLPVSGSRPSARYKHAAEVADGKLYISGGSRNGRHLSDVQVLDLITLTWSTIHLHMVPKSDQQGPDDSQEVLPATSGHSLVKWGTKLLLLGGYSKEFSDIVTVRSIDLETHECHVIKTLGQIPVARGGQSVTLVGSRLVMFGGEHTSRRLLNDIHILDLETMRWDLVETTQTPPAPRFDHTATVYSERYLLIFGGCSQSICFNDLHILDLETMEWSQPQTQGDAVTPRAGHAGIAIQENWYIVGGGDNNSGASETMVLNMSKLVWSVLTSVKERDPLASEGLSLCSATIKGERLLLAFGGYFGNYNNEVFVLRPKPRDLSKPKIFQSPAAAAAAASVTAAYALTVAGEKKANVSSLEESKLSGVQAQSSPQDSTASVSIITTEKKKLESSLEAATAENSKLESDLNELNGTYAELSKELLSVKGQLTAETSRCFKLEAQITELKKNLESLHSIEDELQVLRNAKSALDRETKFGSGGSAQRQNSGVWQWIAGGTSDQ